MVEVTLGEHSCSEETSEAVLSSPDVADGEVVQPDKADGGVTQQELEHRITQSVPTVVKVRIPKDHEYDKEQLIDRANAKAAEVMNNARLAIVNSYVQGERNKLERQKPLLYIVACFTGLQLLVFNVVVAGAVWLAFEKGDASIVKSMINVLKYYIGATVVELIGMLTFITSATFSTKHIKTMELLLSDSKSADLSKR